MLIYRYLKSHALETIRDGLLKVSRLSEFNDPFEGMFGMPESFSAKEAKAYVEKEIKRPSIECSPRLYGLKPHLPSITRAYVVGYPRKRQEMLQAWSKGRDEFIHVVCFTSSKVSVRDEIVMWSHYADNHRGVRLGFEITPVKTRTYALEAVSYTDERIQIALDEEPDATGKKMYAAHKTKSKAWEYEAEYRLLIHRERPEVLGFRYSKSWLRSVDFGAACDDSKTIESIRDFVRSSQRPIKLRKASYHENEFALVYDEIKI
jgi:hypothetical protein